MGKVSLRAKKASATQKIEETLAGTIVHQRQMELAIGRWDFVVFGPSGKKKGEAVARVCVAEQLLVQSAPMFMAAMGDPATIGAHGLISVEELTGGDVSEELYGLEIYHISPIRPINITERIQSADIDRMRDMVLEQYSGRNIAIIETPDEEAWIISALKYLDECDEIYSDHFISTIRSTMRGESPVASPPNGYLQ